MLELEYELLESTANDVEDELDAAKTWYKVPKERSLSRLCSFSSTAVVFKYCKS
jgi:hypothetical protein